MIAFVAAEAREFSGLLPHLSGKRKLKWKIDFAVSGRLNNVDVLLVANGPGRTLARAAAEAAKAHYPAIDRLVSVGFCGALDPALHAGQVVRAREGEFVCSDRVAVTSEEKSQLRKTGASIVEMEAGALAERAHAWNVPFDCIRVVTDTAADGFLIDFNRMREPDGHFSRTKIMLAACRRPFKLIPELLKLDKTCRMAARELGDFLADCRF